MWPRPFRPWTGLYQKIEYDVMLPDGTIVPNCWPNAGFMNAVDGTNRKWSVTSNIKIRRSALPEFNEIPIQYQ
jgi:hypothetical protein